MDSNILKAINIIHYDGMSINLNKVCMSYTNFNPGQILEAVIYEDMIVKTQALPDKMLGKDFYLFLLIKGLSHFFKRRLPR